MPSQKNKIVVASAGGRKTTSIVEDALKQPKSKKILITTYTIENLDQISSLIIQKNGFVPVNINIVSWFSFLLLDGIRPYQNLYNGDLRVKSIDFETAQPPRYVPKTNIGYYINKADNIYRNRVSDLVFRINGISGGLVVNRLEKIYDQIYIDEMQDLSGWDHNFIELLLNSSVKVLMVGDPRQSTYTTTNSLKNRGITGSKMLSWITRIEKKGLCIFEEKTECYRCNQGICDFADEIYPELKETTSKKVPKTSHDGVFTIRSEELETYVNVYKPVILRWDKNTDTFGYKAINIGVSKGRTFNRVLIFPTTSMKKYIGDKKLENLKPRSRSKLYVAVTRARYSVCFVVD